MRRIVYDCDRCEKEFNDRNNIRVSISRTIGGNDYIDVDLCPHCMSLFASNLLHVAYDMVDREKVLKNFIGNKNTAR